MAARGRSAEHIIELPTGATMHQVVHLFRRCAFFPARPSRFVLRFNPRKQVLDPFVIALLAAWGEFWDLQGVPILCENTMTAGARYAQRLGLFRHIPGATLPDLAEHEPAGRFVELRRVETQEELSALSGEIAGVLRVPYLIGLTQYFLAEMTRNAIEHAGAAAFVCAQYYETDKRVVIGIADCGRGVQESLRENFGFDSDMDAITAALKPGVSGSTRGLYYSAPDNAGLGLYYARGISLASGRPFVITSGSASFKQLGDQEAHRPRHDPTRHGHRVADGLHEWQGTAVGLSIRGDHGNLGSFLRRIGATLNIGAGMSRTPKLNFT